MTTFKLAFIIEKYFAFGGLQRDMQRFARSCAKKGHDVTVFTGSWDGPKDDLLNVKIVNFAGSSNHRKVLSVQSFAQNLQKENKFDCITGFSRVRGLDIYFAGDPCYKAKLQRNGKTWLSFLPRYRTYLQLEKNVFGPNSDTHIMAISPAELETISQIYKINPDRISLLPPGIDNARLQKYSMDAQQRTDFRKQYNVADDDFLILTIGSSFITKGIDRAINAIASLDEDLKKKCHYIVIGQGNIKKFQALADKANIGKNITFTGGRQDIGAFYYASDLLLHPARTETAGHTLLEAMTCALPVIATEHCGYSKYISDAQGGILCPEPYNQNKLNDTLKDFLDDKTTRSQCSQNALKYTQTADIYSMTEKAVDIILNRAAKNKAAK